MADPMCPIAYLYPDRQHEPHKWFGLTENECPGWPVRCGCPYEEHDPWCPGTPREWNPETDINYGARSGQPIVY